MSTTTAVFGAWLLFWPVPGSDIANNNPQQINIPKQHLPILPPPEWDYPFPGKLYISAENDFAQMIVGCNFPPETTRMIHGCAAVPGTYARGIGFIRGNECMILLAKRELVEQYYDYDETIRHEIAHCHGWRHDSVTAEKPAWPRVIDKVADNQTEKPKADVAETPKVAKPKIAARKSEPADVLRACGVHAVAARNAGLSDCDAVQGNRRLSLKVALPARIHNRIIKAAAAFLAEDGTRRRFRIVAGIDRLRP
jgi:hypothetical protein